MSWFINNTKEREWAVGVVGCRLSVERRQPSGLSSAPSLKSQTSGFSPQVSGISNQGVVISSLKNSEEIDGLKG